MPSQHLASDVASDLLFVRGSLPTDASADALGEFVDLLHSILVPNPDREKVAAVRFAVDVFRSKA